MRDSNPVFKTYSLSSLVKYQIVFRSEHREEAKSAIILVHTLLHYLLCLPQVIPDLGCEILFTTKDI